MGRQQTLLLDGAATQDALWSRVCEEDRRKVVEIVARLLARAVQGGIRGQVSELELDYSIQRMIDARWNKARRGELMTVPPAGYDLDDLNQLVLTADESVAHAIRTVFAKLDELGSARQVLLWWRQHGLKYPVRRMELRTHPITWLEPN